MTDRERAARAKQLAHGALFPYKVRPNSPRWNEFDRLMDEIGVGSTPPPPPPPGPKYAPRAYNSTGSADARFCMGSKWGVSPSGNGFVDARGVRYDEAGRDLGGRTNNTSNPIPELKGANSMDGREPCDVYIGPTGRTIGGAAGYPERSFER